MIILLTFCVGDGFCASVGADAIERIDAME